MTHYTPEQLVELQVQLEERAITEAKEFYEAKRNEVRSNVFTKSDAKTSLADLAPGQALVRRAVEPVARHLAAWYFESLTANLVRGLEAAQVLHPLFTLGVSDVAQSLEDNLRVVAERYLDAEQQVLVALERQIDPEFDLLSIVELSEELKREAYFETVKKGALTIAFLAVRAAVAKLGESRTQAFLAIADGVKDELEMLAFKSGYSVKLDGDGNPIPLSGVFAFVLDELKKSGATQIHKRKVLMSKIQWKGFKVDRPEFGRELRAKLGAELLYRVAHVTGWFEMDESFISGGKTQLTLNATPEFNEVLEQAHDLASVMSPRFPVMVTKPADWDSIWTGGYVTPALRSRVTFIKSSNREYLKDLNINAHQLSEVFLAINQLQSTAYKINEGVYKVMSELWDSKSEAAGMAVQEPMDLDDYTPEAIRAQDAYKAWYKEASKSNPELKTSGRAERYSMFLAESPSYAPGIESFREISAKRAKAYSYNAHPRRLGDLLETKRILSIAKTLVELDTEFFFPLQLDSRGRAYYVSLFLNPQQGDMSKGLLTYSSGKTMNKEAAMWLAIHGANTWDLKPKDDLWIADHAPTKDTSLSKCSYGTRHAWVIEHQDDIWASAKDPLGHDFWMRADNPWSFLAFCFEWAGWMQHGENFESSLPCYVDGTCNGVQHWTAILRDQSTAPKVNLVPTAQPGDLYADVANYCSAKLDEMSGELANFWRGKLTRDLVKTPVMTKAYGSTAKGQRDMLKSKLTDEKKADKDFMALKGIKSANVGDDGKQKSAQGELLTFLTSLVREGIAHEAQAAEVGMQWLQVVARTLANSGIPLGWTTPDGLPVWQGYRKTEAVRIVTVLNGEITFKPSREVSDELGVSAERLVTIRRTQGENHAAVLKSDRTAGSALKKDKKTEDRIQTTFQEPTEELNVAKQANAIAPNLVHSLDGAHLRATVRESFKRGITHFSGIHDSFGTHAADVAELQKVIRETFVDIHSGDVLKLWYEEVMQIVTEDKREELEAKLKKAFGGKIYPARGTLDINEVLDSPYIFG